MFQLVKELLEVGCRTVTMTVVNNLLTSGSRYGVACGFVLRLRASGEL